MSVVQSSELTLARYKVEHDQGWKDEIKRIPFLTFRSDWQVRVIPPFGDAVVRFQVLLSSGLLKSVYMDARNSLGMWGSVTGKAEAYWEVYPYKGDVGRCDLDDTIMLMEMIQDETDGDEDGTDEQSK